MLDTASATLAIKTIASMVRQVDSVFDTWSTFRKTGEVTAGDSSEHPEQVALSPGEDALLHTTNGHIAKQITRNELATLLDPMQLNMLQAIEMRMGMLVSKWSAITASFDTFTPEQRSEIERQLAGISVDLGTCLGQVMAMLEKIGFQLQDHYGTVKTIAAQG